MRLGFKTASFVVGMAMFAAALPAGALEVGDKAPAIPLLGVSAAGETLVAPIVNVLKEGQSYTLVEFFQTENPESVQNLGPVVDLAVVMDEFVATRLVATNTETSDVKTYIANNQSDIRFPVQFDDKGDAQRAYGVTQVPTIFVLKDEKTVLYKHVGLITPDVSDEIRKAVGF